MTESIGEPLSTNLIERYLRARGQRYFRGHHDAEFFFVANAHLRLHVHLEISPPTATCSRSGSVPHTSSPPPTTPGWRRSSTRGTCRTTRSPRSCTGPLIRTASAWPQSGPDQDRIRFDDFATFVDNAVSAATELFGQLTAAGLPPTATPPLLRDAG